MSDEESVAEVLAKMAQTKKKAPPARRSARARQPTNKDDSDPDEPSPPVNKRSKKGSDEVKALKAQIRDLKKKNAELNATLKARTTEADEAKAAREEQDTLVKQQKKQINSLNASIKDTETGDSLKEVKECQKENKTLLARTTTAETKYKLLEEAHKSLKSDLTDTTRAKKKAEEDLQKEKRKSGKLEGKMSGLLEAQKQFTDANKAEVRGAVQRKNKQHASNLNQKQKDKQVQTRQQHTQFLAQQHQQASVAFGGTSGFGPTSGFGRGNGNGFIPFQNGQATNPISYQQSMHQQQQQCQFDQMMASYMAQHNNNTTGRVSTDTTGTTTMAAAMAPQHSPGYEEYKKKKQAEETIELDDDDEEEEEHVSSLLRFQRGFDCSFLDEDEDDEPATQDSNPISDTD